jgi:hypothetical protein
MNIKQFILIALSCIGAFLGTAGAVSAQPVDEGLLGPLWHGQAHFQQLTNLDWSKPPYNSGENSAWITVANGKWYVFSRIQPAGPKPTYCPHDYQEVAVRESDDQGRTWSKPVRAVQVQANRPADACAILDGSTYYDAPTNTWQMLTQCLAVNNEGGWNMCHYSRVGDSPMGPFQPDPANPVVRSGQLWNQICSGPGKACQPGITHDEGTPDIVEKKGGYFYVTFHGWGGAKDDRGFRGVAKTADFRHYITKAPDLPDDAMFSAQDCQSANPGCIGMGEATSLFTGSFQYLLGETPNISLTCRPGQTWVFSLYRANRDVFPSWRSGWQPYPHNPLITPSWGNQKCGTQYARLFEDRGDVFLIYEDIGPDHKFTERRLMKLMPGPGPAMEVQHPANEPAFVKQ